MGSEDHAGPRQEELSTRPPASSAADAAGLVDNDGDELETRARIFDSQTGETRYLKKRDFKGLDDFPWIPADPTKPSHYSFSAWQMADDAHPVGAGTPGYRLVHKLVRAIPVPSVTITWPNLRLQMTTGPVTRGEPRFTNAMPWRGHGSFLVPEWGELVVHPGGGLSYKAEASDDIRIDAHQETTRSGNYLELLFHLPDGDWSDFENALAAGQVGVAPLTATIDLMFGERILGPVITEEVGEIFPDWHWNRRLGGRTVALESQLTMESVDGRRFSDILMRTVIRQTTELSDAERSRLRVASQWYWRASGEREKIMRYLSYWLCIEALELGENANIKPLKLALAAALEVDISDVASLVNHLYRVRNQLAHGKARDVPDNALGYVELVARLLLEKGLVGALVDEQPRMYREALRLHLL